MPQDQRHPVQFRPVLGQRTQTPRDDPHQHCKNGGGCCEFAFGRIVPATEVGEHGDVDLGVSGVDIVGLPAEEHLVADHPQGEDVTLGRDLAVVEEFGTAVGQGEAGFVRCVGGRVQSSRSGW